MILHSVFTLYISETPLATAEGGMCFFSGLWECSLWTMSMSHSLCLVRTNMLEADHRLSAYKWKHIAFPCFIIFSAAECFIPLRGGAHFTGANVGSVDLISMLKSEDQWWPPSWISGKSCKLMISDSLPFCFFHTLALFPFQSNTFVYHLHIGYCICVHHLLKRLDKKRLISWILKICVFSFFFKNHFIFLCFLQPGQWSLAESYSH